MVCKAQCDGLLCAAKLLHTMVACDWTIQSFHQECKILSSLAHPNIIQYLGTHSEGPSNPVLLMELMDSSLTSFLEGSPSLSPFPFHTEVNLCHDISLALAYLHSNDIIHRDLSSNNVLLTKDKRAKVTDFGMSKLMGTDRHMSRLTQVPGCAVYMPPEAQVDKPVYTSRLDSFSFGVLAIQILTRKFPAPGPPRRRISDPKYGPNPIEVPIPEPERRKSHIGLVDPAHPILKVALACLSYEEKDRPSSGELCSQVGEMKESSQYAEGVWQEAEGGAKVELQGQRDLELSQLYEQLRRSEEETKMLKECVEELTSQLECAAKEREPIINGRNDVITKKSNGGIADSELEEVGILRAQLAGSEADRQAFMRQREALESEVKAQKAMVSKLSTEAEVVVKEHERERTKLISDLGTTEGKLRRALEDQARLQQQVDGYARELSQRMERIRLPEATRNKLLKQVSHQQKQSRVDIQCEVSVVDPCPLCGRNDFCSLLELENHSALCSL